MTYKELNRTSLTWIASHVATDLLMMHDPNEEVTPADLKRVAAAKRRDDAIAAQPRDVAVRTRLAQLYAEEQK